MANQRLTPIAEALWGIWWISRNIKSRSGIRSLRVVVGSTWGRGLVGAEGIFCTSIIWILASRSMRIGFWPRLQNSSGKIRKIRSGWLLMMMRRSLNGRLKLGAGLRLATVRSKSLVESGLIS